MAAQFKQLVWKNNMFKLAAKIREKKEETTALRDKGFLPAVLYGPKTKNFSLKIDKKEFEKVFKEAGESSLIELEIEDKKDKFLVLIHDFQLNPVKDTFSHIDFYQPALDEETEVTIPLIFVGESLAVKDLAGTLVKSIQELAVRALPQDLPHQITVNVEKLKTFDDEILIKDLIIPEKVKIMKNPEEIVAFVSTPEKIEEELEKPIEEKVEEVEKVGEKEKEAAAAETTTAKEEKIEEKKEK